MEDKPEKVEPSGKHYRLALKIKDAFSEDNCGNILIGDGLDDLDSETGLTLLARLLAEEDL